MGWGGVQGTPRTLAPCLRKCQCTMCSTYANMCTSLRAHFLRFAPQTRAAKTGRSKCPENVLEPRATPPPKKIKRLVCVCRCCVSPEIKGQADEHDTSGQRTRPESCLLAKELLGTANGKVCSKVLFHSFQWTQNHCCGPNSV